MLMVAAAIYDGVILYVTILFSFLLFPEDQWGIVEIPDLLVYVSYRFTCRVSVDFLC